MNDNPVTSTSAASADMLTVLSTAEQQHGTAQPPPPPPTSAAPGKRAQVTRSVLLAASDKVAKSLTDKAMRECFPELERAYKDAFALAGAAAEGASGGETDAYNEAKAKARFEETLKGLRETFLKEFKERVPAGWEETCRKYSFVERANELDKVVDEAKRAMARGDEPRNLYHYGADGTITIPSATIPVLRNATADLKAKRLALAERNKLTYERILQDKAVVERQEQQIRDIVQEFKKATAVLQAIDTDELEKQKEQMLQSLTPDQVAQAQS